MNTQPQPVVNRAAIASAITLVATVLALVGVNVSDVDQETLVNGVVAILGVVAVISQLVAAFRARKHVTPIAAPKDDGGHDLVPMGSLAASMPAHAGFIEDLVEDKPTNQ